VELSPGTLGQAEALEKEDNEDDAKAKRDLTYWVHQITKNITNGDCPFDVQSVYIAVERPFSLTSCGAVQLLVNVGSGGAELTRDARLFTQLTPEIVKLAPTRSQHAISRCQLASVIPHVLKEAAVPGHVSSTEMQRLVSLYSLWCRDLGWDAFLAAQESLHKISTALFYLFAVRSILRGITKRNSLSIIFVTRLPKSRPYLYKEVWAASSFLYHHNVSDKANLLEISRVLTGAITEERAKLVNSIINKEASPIPSLTITSVLVKMPPPSTPLARKPAASTPTPRHLHVSEDLDSLLFGDEETKLKYSLFRTPCRFNYSMFEGAHTPWLFFGAPSPVDQIREESLWNIDSSII
jgi:hypothetical protein